MIFASYFVVPLPVQLPVNVRWKALKDGASAWASITMWDNWKKLQVPGFSLAHIWPLWTSRWKILSLSSNSASQINIKIDLQKIFKKLAFVLKNKFSPSTTYTVCNEDIKTRFNWFRILFFLRPERQANRSPQHNDSSNTYRTARARSGTVTHKLGMQCSSPTWVTGIQSLSHTAASWGLH